MYDTQGHQTKSLGGQCDGVARLRFESNRFMGAKYQENTDWRSGYCIPK